jgi:DtxR family transcriptional regulator, Mn-dependent transcriptional regulator
MTDVWKEFEENTISHSAAHHLIAIVELRSSIGYARVTDVAKHLNITSGSASTNLKGLKQRGFVFEDGNKFLQLTDEGVTLADLVIRRKKVLKTFLADVLMVSEEQAEVDSCKTEHLISIETTIKLERYLNDNSLPKAP